MPDLPLAASRAGSADRAIAGSPQPRSFFGHPHGLAVLFATEGFVAFAQYGVQSILVLALSSSILRNGAASQVLGLAAIERSLGLGRAATPQAGAALIAGLFGAMLFGAPMLGGIVADRLLGHARSVMAGLLLFSCGIALLTVRPLFLFGLLLAVIGVGLAGAMKAQVGGLYRQEDPRRSNGFQLYSVATMIAVVFAPLVCGALGEERSWSLGFAAASAGGLLAFAVYVAGRRGIVSAETVPEPRATSPAGGLRALTRRDWRVLLGLLLLLPVLALATVGNMEIYDGYLLWAKQHYDLRWSGHTMPVSWLFSVDAFISMGATAITIAVWSWFERRGRPVSDMAKIAVGAVLCALATLLLTLAPTGRVGLGWGLGFHVLDDLGFTNTYVVSMSLYSRLAPPALRATVTSACTLQIFLANLMVSQLASRLGMLGPTRFWLLHTVLIGAAAAVLILVIGVGRFLRARGRTRPVPAPV